MSPATATLIDRIAARFPCYLVCCIGTQGKHAMQQNIHLTVADERGVLLPLLSAAPALGTA